MNKEEKNIDFYTTGRQSSEQEFARISEWIKKDKAKKDLHKTGILLKSIIEENKRPAASADTTQNQQ